MLQVPLPSLLTLCLSLASISSTRGGHLIANHHLRIKDSVRLGIVELQRINKCYDTF
jgi:hypothetical protein